MSSPIYIGVSGRAGSGKDPAAQVLSAFTDGPTGIIALSAGLKEMLAARYGVVPTSPLLQTAAGKASPSPNPLQEGNTVRNDLQMLGDKTRELDSQIWIRDMRRRAEQQDLQYVIVPDIRYPNELQEMDLCIWIGPDTEGDHQTENALSSQDFTPDLRFMQPEVWERLRAIRQAGEQIVERAKRSRVVQADDCSDMTLTQVIDQLEREDQLEERDYTPLDYRSPKFEPEEEPRVVDTWDNGPWSFHQLSDGTQRVRLMVQDLTREEKAYIPMARVQEGSVVGAGPFRGLAQQVGQTAEPVLDVLAGWLAGESNEPGVSLNHRWTLAKQDSAKDLDRAEALLLQQPKPGCKFWAFEYDAPRAGRGVLVSATYGPVVRLLGGTVRQMGQLVCRMCDQAIHMWFV